MMSVSMGDIAMDKQKALFGRCEGSKMSPVSADGMQTAYADRMPPEHVAVKVLR